MPHYISIPEPCNENWAAMTPKEQGRFCDKCTKVVMDFSNMSNEEILAYLKKQKDEVCGRVRKDQLSSTSTLSDKLKKFLYAFALIFLPFISIKGYGQINTNSALVKDSNTSKNSSLVMDSTSSADILRGLELIGDAESHQDSILDNSELYKLNTKVYHSGFNCGTLLGSVQVTDHFMNIRKREWKGPIR